MRDSLGGLVNIIIIAVFIVLIMGYLAFNVNYTKAFRMRDKTIDVYNRYKGKCEDQCLDEIREYARSIGYTNNRGCPENFESRSGLFCERKVNVQTKTEYQNAMAYYVINTYVSFDIPILNNIIGLFNDRSRRENQNVDENIFSAGIFEIRGNTKTFVFE